MAQRLAAPEVAPAVFSDHPLEVAVEVVDALHRPVHVGIAKHLPPDRHSLVVQLVGHHSTSFRDYGPPCGEATATELRKSINTWCEPVAHTRYIGFRQVGNPAVCPGQPRCL